MRKAKKTKCIFLLQHTWIKLILSYQFSKMILVFKIILDSFDLNSVNNIKSKILKFHEFKKKNIAHFYDPYMYCFDASSYCKRLT